MEKNNLKFSVKTITTGALLIALSIVFTRFLSFYIPILGANSIRVGFGTIPIIISGFVLGPFAGAFVGGISDLIGYWLNPVGAFFPGFTLTSALYGFIPGFVTYYMIKKYNALSLIMSIMFCEIICSIFLNTLWIRILYHTPFMALLPWRTVSAFVMMSVHYAIDGTLLKVLKFRFNESDRLGIGE